MRLIFVLCLAFATSMAFAAPSELKLADTKHPCNHDYRFKCTPDDKLPVKANKFLCLNLKFNELRPVCQDFITTQLDHLNCNEDTTKFCQGADRNLNRVFECLRANVNKLAPECKEEITTAIKRVDDRFNEFKANCTPQDVALCPMTDLEKKKCQREKFHKGELSPNCQKAIEKALPESRGDQRKSRQT